LEGIGHEIESNRITSIIACVVTSIFVDLSTNVLSDSCFCKKSLHICFAPIIV